jgi:hypothetical protein
MSLKIENSGVAKLRPVCISVWVFILFTEKNRIGVPYFIP